MKICVVVQEVFGNTLGGFGRMALELAQGLVIRGMEASVVAPSFVRKTKTHVSDGVSVTVFPRWRYPVALDAYREIQADIYHSQQPSLGTFLSQLAHPRRRHIVTVRCIADWKTEWSLYSLFRKTRSIAFNSLAFPLIRYSVGKAHAVGFKARFLRGRVADLYGIKRPMVFLPDPIAVPPTIGKKASEPTALFLGRWDPVKRPELFLQLAREMPEVRFIAVGASPNPARDGLLRRRYADLSNLTMTGAINPFETGLLEEILQRAWILVNTSVHEGLPVAFLEAAAHGCAILSYVNPEDFTVRFGFHAGDSDLKRGLEWLLMEDRWRTLGQRAHRYIRKTHGRALERHLSLYHRLLET